MDESARVTESVVLRALAKDMSVPVEDITLLNREVVAGSALGDNYSCIMKSVDVKARLKGNSSSDVDNVNEVSRKYIVKCVPANAFREKVVKESRMFLGECLAYERLLPRLSSIAASYGLEKRVSAPRCLLASDEDGVIVMEDLRLRGYAMADKVNGLTLPEAKLVLDQLALLHGLSHHLVTSSDLHSGLDLFLEATDNWMRHAPDEHLKLIEDYYHGLFQNIGDMLAVACKDEDLVARVRALDRKTKMKKAHATSMDDVKAGKFVCVVHNDSWTNNFLFRKDSSGAVCEVALVDWQLTKLGRPTIDLAYLLFSSSTPQFRKEHLQELLRYYHSSLMSVMSALGRDGAREYSFERMWADFTECTGFGFILALVHATAHLSPPETAVDTNSEDDQDLLRKLDEYKKAQLERAKSDAAAVLNRRLVDLAVEAKDMGII